MKLFPRMGMFTTVPLLPPKFHGVENDSFIFYFTEIPIKLDIQMAFYFQEKYDGGSVVGYAS